MALQALRQIDGFADLERRGDFTSAQVSTSSHGSNSFQGSSIGSIPKRTNPDLLLEIIETMILSKNDPQSKDLQQRISVVKSFDDMVKTAIESLDVRLELERAIVDVNKAIDTIDRIQIGLNFILARQDKLRIVRRPAKRNVSPTKQDDQPDSSSNTISILAKYMRDVQNLFENAESTLNTLAICQEMVIGLPAIDIDEPPVINMDEPANLSPLAPQDATLPDIDKYLSRAIKAARIAQDVEDYLIYLFEIVQKIRGNLDIAFAQCAVLMSKRAIMAW